MSYGQTPLLTGDNSDFRRTLPSVSTLSRLDVARSQIVNVVGDHTYNFELPSQRDGLDLTLFDVLARAKICTAQFSMFLDRGWRDRFFKKLDRMHRADTWDTDDVAVLETSVRTFLRSMLAWKPKDEPAIGLSVRGHMLASWKKDSDRLTVEFLPHDKIAWVLLATQTDDDRASGLSSMKRLSKVISPYPQVEWFDFVESP